MKAATLALLARPGSPPDRARTRLLTAGSAAAGSLLVAAASIARLRGAADERDRGLAPYVTEAGLRPGVVLAAVLLVVPVLALALQALRVGGVARDRRMASLRLAGATPGEVRTIAAAEVGTAAAIGGLLAGPGYLVLWLVFGVLAPGQVRLLPEPGPADALTWVLVVVLAGAGGALAGALVHRGVVVEPLGISRRARRPAIRRRTLVARAAAVLVVLAFGVPAALSRLVDATASQYLAPALLAAVVVALLAAVASAATAVVAATGRRLGRSGRPVDLLAGARLQDDPSATGRVAAVLFVCGWLLGSDALLATDLLLADTAADDLAFYFSAITLAAAALVVAAGIATLALTLGVADQLLDARRSLASLAALGVEEATLVRTLRRQLTVTAVPATTAGVLAGGLLPLVLLVGIEQSAARVLAVGLVILLGTTLVATSVVHVVCGWLARGMRRRLRAAGDPANLRVA